jgi:REP element-mobilizing transposase RayT
MTKHNTKWPNRRSVRLRGYDYSQPGAYFVTINVQGGHCVLGDVVDGHVRLTDLGQIADAFWDQVPERFPHVSIDQKIVMPNHVHVIIVIHDPLIDRTGEREDPASTTGAVAPADTPTDGKRPTLGQIVAYYKHQTTVRINERCGNDPARFWQRSFYDQIIRNRRALDAIRKYIADNPPNWELDRDHPDNLPGTRKGRPYVH